MPLEPYLAGVVGEEMPDYWEPQALRAQAIAARTYCLYIKNRFGVNRSYDVSRTQSSQVYGGIAAESSQIWDAVNSTCGKVLIRRSLGRNRDDCGFGCARRDPQSESSIGNPRRCSRRTSAPSAAGHTSNSEEVFGDSFAPLKGVPCPYCKDVAKLGLFFWPDGPVRPQDGDASN